MWDVAQILRAAGLIAELSRCVVDLLDLKMRGVVSKMFKHTQNYDALLPRFVLLNFSPGDTCVELIVTLLT